MGAELRCSGHFGAKRGARVDGPIGERARDHRGRGNGQRGRVLAAIAGLALALTPLEVGCGGGAATGGGPIVTNDNDHSVTINEIMALNVLSATDETGAAAPWIELYNPTTSDIALHGYALTDDLKQPHKAVLPAGLVLPAGDHLVLWCDGRSSLGKDHVAVTLTLSGGAVGLARPDGSFVDRVNYGAQVVDFSAAREPDGSSAWVPAEWHISPGAANPAGSGAAAAPIEAQDQPPESVADAGDISPKILGTDVRPSYELRIADGDIATLRAQPDTWVKATLVYDGRAYGPVGVNLKGTASFRSIDAKPAFRVHADQFADGARFFGIRELYFNNMINDGSMMHERIAYWAIAQVGGVPASRANYAMVTLNGQLLGLYSHLEEPRAQMLGRFFTDSSGPFYTIHYADFAPAYLDGFQPQGGPDDRTLINALTQALALQPAATAIAAAGMSVNQHEFNRYWALMVITGHWGGWPYAATAEPVGANAGVYADPTSHQLNFVPEGIDDTFYTTDFDFLGQIKSTLPAACRKVPTCFQDFANQVWEILDKLDSLNWVGEADRVAMEIAPLVQMDTRKEVTNDQVSMFQQQMRYYMVGRRFYLSTKLPPASP